MVSVKYNTTDIYDNTMNIYILTYFISIIVSYKFLLRSCVKQELRYPKLQITLFIWSTSRHLFILPRSYTIVDNYIICYHIFWLTLTALSNHIVRHITINNPIYNTNDSADQLAYHPLSADISTTCLFVFLPILSSQIPV